MTLVWIAAGLSASSRRNLLAARVTPTDTGPVERVDVWRAVEATNEGGLVFRVGDTEAPPAEDWEFARGTRVRCE
jgi:hypothetical protein